MRNKLTIVLIYIIFFFNFNLLSEENDKNLKIGLVAPLSGAYSELGSSLIYSLQLALDEIGDKKVFIVPRDSGFNNKEKLDAAIQDIRSQGVKIIIGPITFKEFEVAKNYSDIVFISPSNINPKFSNNIISVGVSLESQLEALLSFIKKQKQ